MDDLINLIKAIENVNQQLLNENKFLRDSIVQLRASMFKLIEENGALHNELKKTTVHEIVAEFESMEKAKENQPADIRLKE